MNLIFNADDFGLTKGVNYGIIEAFLNGVVTSATMMVNGKAFDQGIILAKQNPNLGMGIHLVLTWGKPIGNGYKTIVDSEGNFLNLKKLTETIDKIDIGEVEKEWNLQIQCMKNSGIEPDHLDSHHHTHTFKGIYPMFLDLAKKYQLPVRLFDRNTLSDSDKEIISPHHFCETFYGESANLKFLLDYLESDQKGPTEMMCHPSYVDKDLCLASSYNLKRMEELAILTDPQLIKKIKEKGYKLIRFSDLT